MGSDAIEAFSDKKSRAKQLALFPDDREELPILACETIRVRLDKIELHRPREWGASWLGLYLWDLLELDTFWRQRLPSSRKGTSWLNILKALICYRLIDPGSEFRFHLLKVSLRQRDRVVKNVLDTAGTNVPIAFKWLWHWY